MTTSGIYDLGLTQNEIIEEAYDLLQIGSEGETLSGPAKKRARNSANLLLKDFSTHGIHLWTYTEGTLFLAVGQSEYDFRESSTHIANTWYETTTTAATAANAMAIAVTSASNIQANDVVGVIQNDNDLFWTTVQSISGLTVNLTDQIPLATLSGAFVRNYRPGTATSPELIPISRMKDVRRKESDDYEIPINFESRKDYFDLPNKGQNGTVIQAHYARQDLAGESYGIMYLWNPPESSAPVINFTYERKLQIFTESGTAETIDLPDYAQNAFIYNLAVKLIPKFGCSSGRAQFLREEALLLKNDMLAYDSAVYPVKVRMKRHG